MFQLRLEITGAQGPAKLVELRLKERGTVRVGRSDCDVLLSDRSVSRSHLGFGVQKGRLVAGDLGSTCGTLHNGKPLKRAKVIKGDLFQVGSSTILILGFSKLPEVSKARRLVGALSRMKFRLNRWAIASSLAAALAVGLVWSSAQSEPYNQFAPNQASLVDIGGAWKSVTRWVRARRYVAVKPDPTRAYVVDYDQLFED